MKVNRTLHTEQTDFQKLEMFETEEWGNMLLLDGMVMTSEKDEFVYHEMVAQFRCLHIRILSKCWWSAAETAVLSVKF